MFGWCCEFDGLYEFMVRVWLADDVSLSTFCVQTDGYFTCLQSAHSRDYWEKCGTQKGKQSYTERGVACQSACEKKGEAYYWCRDDDQASSSWDYCSPPGQVLIICFQFKLNQETNRCSQCNTQYMVMPAVVGALKVTEVPSSFYNLLITIFLSRWDKLLVVRKVPEVPSSILLGKT